jgi:hypothetical protein
VTHPALEPLFSVNGPPGYTFVVMQRMRHLWICWAGLLVAVALAVALVIWLAQRLISAHQLAVARNTFEREVGPLPAPRFAAGALREQQLLDRLGGLARLSGEQDMARIRRLLASEPSTWPPAEIDWCRSLLAANAPLLAAADRAAERGSAAARVARADAVWEHPPYSLFSRARAQSALLRLRLRLGLLDQSPAAVRRTLNALAAEVQAFQEEPEVVFQLWGLALERTQLQAMAWVAADPYLDHQDLAETRHLLASRPFAPAVRQLLANDAGFLLATQFRQPFLGNADLARMLDGYRHLASALSQDGDALRAIRRPRPPALAVPAPAVPLSGRLLAQLEPNFDAIVEEMAAVAAAHQLADLSFDLRLAAAAPACTYPETLDALPLASQPDPLTAHRPLYARDPQGGALLSNPSAAAAWTARVPGAPNHPLPYTWQLPPPCAAPQTAPAS